MKTIWFCDQKFEVPDWTTYITKDANATLQSETWQAWEVRPELTNGYWWADDGLVENVYPIDCIEQKIMKVW